MAGERICVTKVTLEYVAGGKLFAVELDPMEIGSIFFDDPTKPPGPGRRDMTSAKQEQNRLADTPNSKVRRVLDGHFDPLRTLGEQRPQFDGPKTAETEQATKEGFVGATSRVIGPVDTNPGGPAPWWHSNTCGWFHPRT